MCLFLESTDPPTAVFIQKHQLLNLIDVYVSEVKVFPSWFSSHLGDTETVLLKQEILQLHVEFRQEVQVGVHDLEQHQHLRLSPLPASSTTVYVCESVCVFYVGWQ